MNNKKRIIVSSALMILLCFSLLCGASFALFTSSSSVNIAVTSGKVEVSAKVTSYEVYSKDVLQANNVFENGGTANYDSVNNELVLDKITPGDKVLVNIEIVNNSNVNVLSRVIVDNTTDNGLFSGLKVNINLDNGTNEEFSGYSVTDWQEVMPTKAVVVIGLPLDASNEYQDKKTSITFKVEAVQGNADVVNGLSKDESGNWLISNEAELKYFSQSVNNGNTYEGETVLLTSDINLNGNSLIAIGNSKSQFLGTFDGCGFTVSNFIVTNTDGTGLFGYAGKAGKYVTIKNLKIDCAFIYSNHYAGAVVGKLWGSALNCSVTNTNIYVTPDGTSGNYDNGDKAGAVVGWVDNGVVDNNIVDNVYISAYRDLGGVVGCAVYEGVTTKVTNNTVTNVVLEFDNSGKVYSNPQANAFEVVGRVSGNVFVDDNTYQNVTLPL